MKRKRCKPDTYKLILFRANRMLDNYFHSLTLEGKISFMRKLMTSREAKMLRFD